MTGQTVRMFVNGQAMSGGSIHGPLARHGDLIGVVRTAPQYRFWSCRDEFPGLQPVTSGGWAVPGELYAVDYAVLRSALLPLEPPELELTVIALADGTGSLSMRFRDAVSDRADELLRPIPPGMGWSEYLDRPVGRP
jgi:hypothetical protein